MAEGWLPYYDWVVYMAPDVGVAAAESLDLNALIARVPDHVDVVAQSVHGGFADWREGAADCSVLLLRRSWWTLELLQRIYDRPEATCEESLKKLVDGLALPFERIQTNFTYLAQLYGRTRSDALLVRPAMDSVLGVRHLVHDVAGLCHVTVTAAAGRARSPQSAKRWACASRSRRARRTRRCAATSWQPCFTARRKLTRVSYLLEHKHHRKLNF